MPRWVRFVAAGSLAGLLVAGCAHDRVVRTHESVRTETSSGAPAAGTVEQSSRTTTVVEDVDRSRPQGVLSGLVHVVGEILALPFRLVGGLLRVIF